MRNKLILFFSSLWIACLILGNVQAATIPVGPTDSIQAAINAASDGDTLALSAATYVEPIYIVSKSLNIVGAGIGSTIIQAPDASTHLADTQMFTYIENWWCIINVDNQSAPTPQTVNISALTVDGTTQQDTIIAPIYGNSDRFFAIGYHNAAGTVDNVHTTNTKESANFNELAGGGIVNASDTGAVTFNVTNSLVDFYQRIGIDCRGAALTADVSNNTVNRGYILTPNTTTATPIGIQYSGLVTGSITSNTVSENVGTVANASGSGILPDTAGANVIVSGNTLNNNDAGIAGVSCGNNLVISNNTVNFTITPGVNPPQGIVAQDTDGLTTLASNIMNNIPFNNMQLIVDQAGNQPFVLMNNQFIGSQIGLNVTGNVTTGPVVTMNSDVFTGTSQYYIQETTAPNDIWPSTATVSFDGLVSGHMTLAQFNSVLTKIYDKHNDPTLGLVLAYIVPVSPPCCFKGRVKRYNLIDDYVLKATWRPSRSPNIVYYRIYEGDNWVAQISANSPLVYTTNLCHKHDAKTFSITAVNSDNLESAHTQIKIVH